MSQHTFIGWTDGTINPLSGCDGCELYVPGAAKSSCYARTLHEGRMASALPDLYAKSFSEVRMIPGRMKKAADWTNLTGKKRPDKPWFDGMPRHIFIGDMGDLLSDGITDEFLEKEVLGTITSKAGSRHIWQILTKRPARLADLSIKWGGLPDNVVAMTTVTSQRTAEVRIPALLRVRAKVLGISAEPLLSRVNFRKIRYAGGTLDALTGKLKNSDGVTDLDNRVSWVIAGGESGPEARPMHPEWAREIRDDCQATDTWFFMKQWGHWGPYAPIKEGRFDFSGGKIMADDGTVYEASDLAYPDGARYAEAMRANHGRANLTRIYALGKDATGRELDRQFHNGVPDFSLKSLEI